MLHGIHCRLLVGRRTGWDYFKVTDVFAGSKADLVQIEPILNGDKDQKGNAVVAMAPEEVDGLDDDT